MACNYTTEYQQKLTTPKRAIALIPKQGNISMGMAVSEPFQLLKALEERIDFNRKNIQTKEHELSFF